MGKLNRAVGNSPVHTMGTSADGVSAAFNDLHLSDKENANPQTMIERDGRFFLDLLNKEIQNLNRLCDEAKRDIQEASAPEEVHGKIRTAIGKSQLLITKKFKQFEGLCQDNMEPSVAKKKPTSTDLEGFWDMMSLQISDVNNMFSQIDKMRKSSWKDLHPEDSGEDGLLKASSTPPKRSPRNSPRSPRRTRKSPGNGASEEDKARKAARSRLQEHMKAARSRNAANGQPTQAVEVEIKCSPKGPTE